MKMRGAKALIKSLEAQGVKHIFGILGGVVLPIFDEFYKCGIDVILTRHEQGAAHMADAYGRVTGKPGVCIATSGPGATNIVTGIATAYMDSSPMVALTGQVKSHLIGSDAFQEADIIGISRPITKHSYLLESPDEIAQTVKNAFYLAGSGRPGPVLIDIPMDIAIEQTDYRRYPSKADVRGYSIPKHTDPKNVQEAGRMISQSKRPVLYVGGGVNLANAASELTEFARRSKIPVTTTLNGLGAFPETDPLSLKMLGMHGTQYANHAVQECDLLLAVASRFDDRVTGDIKKFAPHAKIIHIDIDPSSIDKNVKVDLEILGNVKDVLRKLLKTSLRPKTAAWLKRIEELKAKYPLKYRNKDGRIAPQFVIDQIGQITNHDAIVATGVGQHQMWTAQWYGFEKARQLVTSGGLGTMGFGIPAAIGAQFAKPKETVFCIDGDGSSQMTIMELATAVYHNKPVKIAILDNNYLGMVRQWQELFYDKRYSSVELGQISPDFVRLAESMGALGMRIETPDEVRPALDRAINHPGPVLMHFCVEKEENVYPMVPAGQALHQMIDMA